VQSIWIAIGTCNHNTVVNTASSLLSKSIAIAIAIESTVKTGYMGTEVIVLQ
jgi:RNA binding exosome subunit